MILVGYKSCIYYVTFMDRVYAICDLFIVISLMISHTKQPLTCCLLLDISEKHSLNNNSNISATVLMSGCLLLQATILCIGIDKSLNIM